MVRIEKEFERRMVSQTTISFVFHSSLSFLPFSYLSSDDLRTDPRFCFWCRLHVQIRSNPFPFLLRQLSILALRLRPQPLQRLQRKVGSYWTTSNRVRLGCCRVADSRDWIWLEMGRRRRWRCKPDWVAGTALDDQRDLLLSTISGWENRDEEIETKLSTFWNEEIFAVMNTTWHLHLKLDMWRERENKINASSRLSSELKLNWTEWIYCFCFFADPDPPPPWPVLSPSIFRFFFCLRWMRRRRNRKRREEWGTQKNGKFSFFRTRPQPGVWPYLFSSLFSTPTLPNAHIEPGQPSNFQSQSFP